MAEKTFKVSVPEEALDLLQKKLALARLPDELEDAGWDYGVPLSHVKKLLEHWQNGYDWRRAEAEINATLPMFTRDIDIDGHGALNIHYVHAKSKVEGAIPLLFVHGWPGSVLEVTKILPLLLIPTEDGAPAFHVVALSLPGYGFSEGPKKPGFGPSKMGETGHKLMLALGYDQYVCQGGDWGFFITNSIAANYGPEHAKAWHTNMAVAGPPHALTEPLNYIRYLLTPYSEREKAGLARRRKVDEGRAYYVQQATKPQTLAYALADSPVGLLAWIYEKLVAWTDAYAWTDDEVLTWISMYWFSRAGPASSLRIYFEYRVEQEKQGGKRSVVNVPTGISSFPKDVIHPPKTWTRSMGDIVLDAEHDKGGHFAAYEVPELLVGDLQRMFGKGGPAFGVVPGKDGY
ncbi:alpha/beta-hydrolase [Peniophora sp. CONT]|nr:alpha/beta-hydrolase [Peniophora sp. CONT]